MVRAAPEDDHHGRDRRAALTARSRERGRDVTTRRDFLRLSAAAGVAFGLPRVAGDRAGDSETPLPPGPGVGSSAARAKRILILGGTGFIGPPEVRYALERGHALTLFNRGRTNPGLFPGVEQLRGDRDGDLRALLGREWDVVIDNHATLPKWVRDSAGLLTNQAEHYVFISTLSVYKSPVHPGTNEQGVVYTAEDLELALAAGGSAYGANKAQAEREVEHSFPGRATIIRPGLIVGPGDPSDRFTYWPVRMHRGGEVLAPGDGSLAVQVIDVRDLTAFIVHMAEQATAGVFNATGPRTPYSMAEFLYGIRAVTAAEVSIAWVPTEFLLEQGIQPWSELTVWRRPSTEGVLAVRVERAIAAGLTYRPLADTAKDTLEWWHGLPATRRETPVAGLAPERERAVLAAWHRLRQG